MGDNDSDHDRDELVQRYVRARSSGNLYEVVFTGDAIEAEARARGIELPSREAALRMGVEKTTEGGEGV